MVAAIFADDGVQLAGDGKIFKGPQQISEHQKAAMQSADPGVKVTVTTMTVWLDGDRAYETGKYKSWPLHVPPTITYVALPSSLKS
jgi:ketosteroid isomerase-like protein